MKLIPNLGILAVPHCRCEARNSHSCRPPAYPAAVVCAGAAARHVYLCSPCRNSLQPRRLLDVARGIGQGPPWAGDRRIFSSSLQPFLVFSWRTSRRPRYGQPFSGSRATWPRLATVGITPVFRTRRSVTVMSCSRNRGGASAPICAINGLLTFGCSTATLFLVLQLVWQHRL